MEPSELLQQSGQASASEADLSALVAAKRQEQGIAAEPKPLASVLAKLAAPLTEEQQRAWEARQREHDRWEADQALIRQRATRDGSEAALRTKAGGDRFHNCRFTTYQATTPYQRKVLASVQEWAETLPERIQNCESLVLFGPVGTGKDHLAFACCRMAIQKHGLTADWINGQDWFGRIRDAMGNDRADTEEETIRKLTAPDVLCISDPLPPFGNLSPHQASMLYRLANARYAAGKATICTVNVADDAEADTRLGAATWDRLCDSAWKFFMNWASYRKPSRELNP